MTGLPEPTMDDLADEVENVARTLVEAHGWTPRQVSMAAKAKRVKYAPPVERFRMATADDLREDLQVAARDLTRMAGSTNRTTRAVNRGLRAAA